MALHEVKSGLARLLATENLTIRHDGTLKSAAFDSKKRVLYLPVWENTSSELYDLLIGHETSKAIDSPLDMKERVGTISRKHFPKTAKAKEKTVASFYQVVEDARLGKRQTRRFPGLKRDYYVGYKELFKRDFFQTKQNGNDFSKEHFIDRLNLHFKVGSELLVPFSREEQAFVKRIEDAETSADVDAIVNDLIQFEKDRFSKPKAQPQEIPQDEEGGAGQDQKNYDMSDDPNEQKSKGKGEGEGEGDEGEDADGDGKPSDKAGDKDGKSGKSDKSGNQDGKGDGKSKGENSQRNDGGKNQPSDGAGNGTSQGDFDLQPARTQEALEKGMEKIAKSGNKLNYYSTNPTHYDQNVINYKEVMKRWGRHFASEEAMMASTPVASFQTFMTAERKVLGYMIKEFEMRKAADELARAQIAKTGVLNTTKLHSYKYNDDLFRKNTILPKGKNHGMMMFIDFSGSMCGDKIKETMKQTLSLVMFCNRLKIPFEVYSFEDSGRFRNHTNRSGPNPGTTEISQSVSGMSCMNILSSRMSAKELRVAMNVCWHIGHGRPHGHNFGGTPLNASIVIAATNLVPRFLKETRVQEMTTIFLSDGDSNRLGVDGFIEWKNKSYEINSNGGYETRDLIAFLKKTNRTNVVGFFMTGMPAARFDARYCLNSLSYAKRDAVKDSKAMEELKSKGAAAFDGTSYDKYFVFTGLKGKGRILETEEKLTADTVTKFVNDRFASRTVLREFVQILCKHNKAVDIPVNG